MTQNDANMLKQRGNLACGSGKYSLAVYFYTAAIKIAPEDAELLTNRAAAYIKIGIFSNALQDSTAAVRLNPLYQQAVRQHVVCLLRTSNVDAALGAAEHLAAKTPSTENLELLADARMASVLLGCTDDSFEHRMCRAVQNLLIQRAIAVKVLIENKFELCPTLTRARDVAAADSFELSRCSLSEGLSRICAKVEQITTNLQKDFEFIAQTVPNALSAQCCAFYYLLKHSMATTKTSFARYSASTSENAENDSLQQAELCIAQLAPDQKLFFRCVLMLKHNQLRQLATTLQELIIIDTRYQFFAASYLLYESLNENGHQELMASSPNAASTFHNASFSLFDYDYITQQPPESIDQHYALLLLAAQTQAAIMLSNEGIALAKTRYYSQALSRLYAATFFDSQYHFAYQLAGWIYSSAQMYAESEQEYSIAYNLTGNQQLVLLIQECHNKLKHNELIDYYAILEISQGVDTSSNEYITKFKRLCQKWHPDRYTSDASMKRFAQYKFRMIQHAHNVISDPKQRYTYNEQLSSFVQSISSDNYAYKPLCYNGKKTICSNIESQLDQQQQVEDTFLAEITNQIQAEDTNNPNNQVFIESGDIIEKIQNFDNQMQNIEVHEQENFVVDLAEEEKNQIQSAQQVVEISSEDSYKLSDVVISDRDDDQRDSNNENITDTIDAQNNEQHKAEPIEIQVPKLDQRCLGFGETDWTILQAITQHLATYPRIDINQCTNKFEYIVEQIKKLRFPWTTVAHRLNMTGTMVQNWYYKRFVPRIYGCLSKADSKLLKSMIKTAIRKGICPNHDLLKDIAPQLSQTYAISTLQTQLYLVVENSSNLSQTSKFRNDYRILDESQKLHAIATILCNKAGGDTDINIEKIVQDHSKLIELVALQKGSFWPDVANILKVKPRAIIAWFHNRFIESVIGKITQEDEQIISKAVQLRLSNHQVIDKKFISQLQLSKQYSNCSLSQIIYKIKKSLSKDQDKMKIK